MDLPSLEIFADVVRTKSFSAVARQRDVSPSAISRVVAALEADLGARLFNRSTRRLAPTEAALLLLERIEPHLVGLRQAFAETADVSDQLSGVLRVTTSTSFGVERLAPLLGEFAALHPKLKLDLLVTDRIVHLIAERFDLALRHGPMPDSTLAVQMLLSTRYYVAASPSYLARHGRPATPRELAKHECLTFPGFAGAWRLRDAKGRVYEAPFAARIAVNSGLVLRRCALDGAGIVLLSDWLIGEDLRSGRLVDLFPRHRATPTAFDTRISAVYPSRKLVPRKVRAFVEFLKQRL
jgi:DNA-binding transcriptional LysR family regulator